MTSKPKTRLKIDLFPGFHDPELTRRFMQALQNAWTTEHLSEEGSLLFETDSIQNYLCFGKGQLGKAPKGNQNPNRKSNEDIPRIIIGFSAGVITGAIAAKKLSRQGCPPLAFIAIDGWGVPLLPSGYPIVRFSHDLFTHNTSTLFGGHGSFFADPPTPHLKIWESPQSVRGWLIPFDPNELAMEMTAAEALITIIQVLFQEGRPNDPKNSV